MTPDSTPSSFSWGRVLRLVWKPLLVAIVLVGIGQAVRMAWLDLQRTQQKAHLRIEELRQAAAAAEGAERSALEDEIHAIEESLFAWNQVRWPIIASSLPIAALSVFPAGIFWWLTIRRFEHQVPFLPTQAAYATGSLGKYVPGKAMVLILRSAAMQRFGVPISTTIVAIFIETLTALAAGGGLGTLTLAALDLPIWLERSLMTAALFSFIPTVPPLFQWALQFLSRFKHLRLPDSLARAMDWRLVSIGWALSVLGLLLMATTLWLICIGLQSATGDLSAPPVAGSITPWRLWFLCVSATSIAFVLGFLSMLPGGAGVRELVVTLLLAPAIGYAPALAAAVLYRVASLLGELITAGLTWYLGLRLQPPLAT